MIRIIKFMFFLAFDLTHVYLIFAFIMGDWYFMNWHWFARIVFALTYVFYVNTNIETFNGGEQ